MIKHIDRELRERLQKAKENAPLPALLEMGIWINGEATAHIKGGLTVSAPAETMEQAQLFFDNFKEGCEEVPIIYFDI